MIHDLDLGDPAHVERRPGWVLPAVAALCVLAFVGVATAARVPQEAAPSVTIVKAGAPTTVTFAPTVVPLPRSVEMPDGGVLALPAETYTSVTRLPNAVSGSTAQEEPLLQYRYRLNDGRFVVLARVPKTDPFRGIDPSSYTASGVRVRGADARVLVSSGTPQLVVLVWTEGIRSYQLSSGTLSVGELIAIADLLR